MKATRIIRAAAVALLAVALFPAVPAHASIIIAVDSVLAAAGSTGKTLEVTLQNTGPSDITVAGFAFEISTADLDITFTGTDISTTDPYVFAGDSLLGPNINTLGSGQTMDGFDLAFSGGDVVAAGSTVGLGRVFFDVAPGAVLGSSAVVTVQPFPGTNLSDSSGANIPIDQLTDGQINITTPEPATVALFGLGFLAVLGLRILTARATLRPPDSPAPAR